jgi:hypothetical protein
MKTIEIITSIAIMLYMAHKMDFVLLHKLLRHTDKFNKTTIHWLMDLDEEGIINFEQVKRYCRMTRFMVTKMNSVDQETEILKLLLTRYVLLLIAGWGFYLIVTH